MNGITKLERILQVTNKIVVAVKGVVINEGKALLIQRSDHDEVGGGTWECAGGKIEFGEDLETALIREIQEEVGLTVIVDRILYAATFKTNPSRQVVILTYLCKTEDNVVTLSNEHKDFIWAKKDQIRLLLPQEIIRDFEGNNVFDLDELV
ncbi:NUDIX domain-containing protein [Bacillus sp. CGMCC 1.16607]|uniref:NUDIX hydrolase n=1 Tax=Bacillus sp. CGMCC 1.16607 TaxID=3351842 RepID=UPI00362DE7C0